MQKTLICRGIAFVSLVCAPLAGAFAQGMVPPPAQALAELRADVQGRADHQAYPITGIDRDDVREVLARSRAWTARNGPPPGPPWASVTHGERQARATSGAERENWHQAWLDYHFGAWPAQNTPGKRADYKKAVEAFREYGKLLDPPAETVRIPFEGKEIVGYLQLPQGCAARARRGQHRRARRVQGIRRRAWQAAFAERRARPLVARHAGHGRGAGARWRSGAERMIGAASTILATRPEVDPQRIAVDGASAGGYWSALAGYTERAAHQGGGRARRAGPRVFPGRLAAQILGHERISLRPQGSAHVGLWLQGGRGRRVPQEARDLLARDARHPEKPSAPMLVVNGEKDTQVPIADLYLLLRTGTPKFAWVNPEGGHTGRSKDFPEDENYRAPSSCRGSYRC